MIWGLLMRQVTLYQFEVSILILYGETLYETACSPIKYYKDPSMVSF